MGEAAKLIFGYPVMIDGFALNSGDLPLPQLGLLDEVAKTVNALRYFNNDGMVFLWGETDLSGPSGANTALGARRAEAVAAYLRRAGVPAAAIQTLLARPHVCIENVAAGCGQSKGGDPISGTAATAGAHAAGGADRGASAIAPRPAAEIKRFGSNTVSSVYLDPDTEDGHAIWLARTVQGREQADLVPKHCDFSLPFRMGPARRGTLSGRYVLQYRWEELGNRIRFRWTRAQGCPTRRSSICRRYTSIGRRFH